MASSRMAYWIRFSGRLRTRSLCSNLGMVVEKTGPGHLLLIPTAQTVPPLAHCIPTALSLHNVAHPYEREYLKQIVVRDTA